MRMETRRKLLAKYRHTVPGALAGMITHVMYRLLQGGVQLQILSRFQFCRRIIDDASIHRSEGVHVHRMQHYLNLWPKVPVPALSGLFFIAACSASIVRKR